jgi:predicted enzyme related to lactoylglutathione lyase
MHRSRLAGFIIDCRTEDLDRAATFWSAALGLPTKTSSAPEDAKYVLLENKPGDLHIEVQKVAHESRVHLDIESDDVEAEVGRLAALGAKVVERIQTWCVMEAPTGQRFCVIRAQHQGFEEKANRWP